MIYLQTQQSVFPKAIYIGDRAELKCQFKTENKIEQTALSATGFASELNYSEYEIKDINVQNTGPDTYNLIISFVPWHTGIIQLPDYELADIGTIHFEGVKVLSLVEQEKVTELKSFSSPMLLPGTTYKIYAGIAVFIILLVVLIRLIVKRHAVAFWLKNLKLKRRYAKNKKNTIRQLKAIAAGTNNNVRNDSEAATLIQTIMRAYLELRLNYPFTKTLTSELSLAFDKATFSLADETRLTAFENIISVFVRTDFIRFSKAQNAAFAPQEKQTLINTLIESINTIESEEKK